MGERNFSNNQSDIPAQDSKESRFQKRARKKSLRRQIELGQAVNSFVLHESVYNLAGVAEQIAQNKMRVLDYDVVLESMKIARLSRSIFDYNAENEAESIINREFSYIVAEREVDQIAKDAWKKPRPEFPNY